MSILYYNPQLISELLTGSRETIESTPFLANTRDVFESYEWFGLNKHNAVYDRTGNLKHFLDITPNLHPIPKRVENYNTSFHEVAERRAKELLSTGKKINVMWSGGIDSTYILYILKEFAVDKDQVRVFGTYNSIIESGDLFDSKIKNDFLFDIRVGARNNFSFHNTDDSIFVSGMCGNQLFGPTDDMFATGDKAMFHHTLGNKETIYESYIGNVNEDLLEFLNPIIQTSPRKIETIADLRWYCIFNLDWYTAIYEHKILLSPEKAKMIHGFFDSTEFQQWAISTNEPFTKVKGDSSTHRWQMRDFLADRGMQHYARNKAKKISTFSIHEPEWLFLLDDYQNIFTG